MSRAAHPIPSIAVARAAPNLVDRPRPVIGRGRSGVVFLDRDESGKLVAAKAFIGDPLGNLVHLLVSGAANPYRWNHDAVLCALYRRRILVELVPYWLGDRLQVAPATGIRWNHELRAWELRTRFVRAFPTALHHPFSSPRDGEQRELAEQIMQPLQRHLEAAGFDGLAWQAGRGNPVAANNFLVSERRDAPSSRRGAEPRWTWIDLESGVPALFPIDPRSLLGYYLPKCWKHRRALFDDVDIDRLARYLTAHGRDLEERIGPTRVGRLVDDARALGRHQRRWHAPSRLQRSLAAAAMTERITPAQAAWYAQKPWTWYRHEIRRLAGDVVSAARRHGVETLRRLTRIDPLLSARNAARFLFSQRHRSRLARYYVLCRIRYWQQRRQLGRRESAYLRRLAGSRGQAMYLTDFAVHLAIKPFYKLGALVGLPLLGQAGILPLWAVAAGVILAGSACRTAYTAGLILSSRLQGQEAPWIALWVGLAPIVGSAAFPVQIIHSSGGREGKLAGFILYDTLTTIGRKVPIWGGPDTATEHAFNRLADRIVTDRGPLIRPA